MLRHIRIPVKNPVNAVNVFLAFVNKKKEFGKCFEYHPFRKLRMNRWLHFFEQLNDFKSAMKRKYRNGHLGLVQVFCCCDALNRYDASVGKIHYSTDNSVEFLTNESIYLREAM